jgi:TetR/AcrR family transcriptional repressor of nem operon
MARPREFDESAVLDAATALFWTQGYEATSTRDLGEVMGLTTASLYNAYGDKRSLYRKALSVYAENALSWCRATLSAPGPGGVALQTFFAALENQTLAAIDPKGCLVVNTGLEMAPHDPEFQTVVTEVFQAIGAALRACVERGQTDGSVSTAQSAEDLANLLLGLLLALRVLARGAPEPGLVRGMIRSADALLKPGARSR